ncbi:YbhB/YbcL family Raf kinase inhibitor-like protein [Protaetiibacter mangrovi]|uniref:YbhB/YbcL family Raf kinase inhibitor-like protein n=1 Tax=Protaetiibacter mangrovi TaxID=2970926 RepID=A0ABT1ZCZ0_9MICO|nr:YbhB/YbcL family Raf kinase inhibitor-like protein [Protaetiibacter mangrovi]MCS0498570.1 YbhB/YbcL family Raf kinase inhibitor-like protein [Protaetiibacter mangrovi]TPX03182.1 YbhB/YbcL family Raf kinase inhibitor-like protein [Schumannella luteola]
MHPVETLLTPLGRALRHRHADEALSIARAPELATPNRIVVTSPSFAEGEQIPDRSCGWLIGQHVSPALRWDALPAETVDVLVIMEDVGSPAPNPRIHAVAAVTPAAEGIPEGGLGAGAPGARFLRGRRGPSSYRGPRPIPGHGPHRYRIHVYALDAPAPLEQLAEVAAVPAAVAGHVLAAGTLTGVREA